MDRRPAGTCMMNAVNVGLFEQQWRAYRAIIDHDWMEHRGLTAACAHALREWTAQNPGRRSRLLDLGCGDLAQMGPVFAELPLKAYVGVDLTETVLPMARAAMGPVPFEAEFRHSDISDFVRLPGEPFDLVHASLVVHHLDDDAKAEFLTALRHRIADDGAFVWADVFRDPGESRDDYVARYAARIRESWKCLSDRDFDEDAREAVVAHMSVHDFPADREAVVEVARQAGWAWQWLWQGSHRAEAVALLIPA